MCFYDAQNKTLKFVVYDAQNYIEYIHYCFVFPIPIETMSLSISSLYSRIISFVGLVLLWLLYDWVTNIKVQVSKIDNATAVFLINCAAYNCIIIRDYRKFGKLWMNLQSKQEFATSSFVEKRKMSYIYNLLLPKQWLILAAESLK